MILGSDTVTATRIYAWYFQRDQVCCVCAAIYSLSLSTFVTSTESTNYLIVTLHILIWIRGESISHCFSKPEWKRVSRRLVAFACEHFTEKFSLHQLHSLITFKQHMLNLLGCKRRNSAVVVKAVSAIAFSVSFIARTSDCVSTQAPPFGRITHQ